MIPAGFSDPGLLWLFPTVCYVGYAVLLVTGYRDFRKSGRLSLTSLGLLAGTTMWWLEWYGDWGSYLLYNPNYSLIPWHQSTWTTANKPWFMIAAYGLYYAVAIPMGLKVIGAVRRRWPSINRQVSLLLLVPYFLVEDLLIEIPATHLGWWHYDNVWGPALHSANSDLPLLFPMVFTTAFVIVGCWLIDQRDANDVCDFERRFGVQKAEAGLARELRRLVAWSVTLNATYVGVLIAPLVALRLAFGVDSAIVP